MHSLTRSLNPLLIFGGDDGNMLLKQGKAWGGKGDRVVEMGAYLSTKVNDQLVFRRRLHHHCSSNDVLDKK